MSVIYYLLNLLQDYEGRNDSFLTSPVVVNMPITNEDKFLIKTFFTSEG